jgi:glycerol-3-phosphate dehydrogenase
VHEEMAMTLTDVMVRRLGLFYEVPGQGLDVAPEVASRMEDLLGWESERTVQEVDEYGTFVIAHRAYRLNDGG